MLNRFVPALFLVFPFFVAGCIVIPPKDNSVEKGPPIAVAEETELARILDPHTDTRPGQSGIYLLPEGKDAFLARIALIEMAEDSIVAQYYIFENDITGRLFLERLLAAADRGVRVRLLVDDLAKTWKDRYLAAAVAHPNFEMSLFNPLVRFGSVRPVKSVVRISRIHRRMHNKELVVDGKIAIVGGRNIGDGYFGVSENPIADLDAIVIGAVVPELLDIFNDYWSYALSVPVEHTALKKWLEADAVSEFREELREWNRSEEALEFIERLKEVPLLQGFEERNIPFLWGTAVAYADDPKKLSKSRYKEETHLAPILNSYVENCERELILISPYFIPRQAGVEMLTGVADRGVKVVVATNGIESSDHALVHSAYSKYRKELLEHGVTLLETKAGLEGSAKSWSLLHVKLFILDRRYVMIGSYNLDPRSNKLNTELMVIFDDPDLADHVLERARLEFDGKLWELNLDENERITWSSRVGEEVETQEFEPGTTWFERQKLKLLRLLPIERQL